MDHVAIMSPDWKLISKILSGEKTIESRWYVTRRAPWKVVKKGDRVYFKDSGKPVTAQADVVDARFYSLESLADAKRIIREHGKEICLINSHPDTWKSVPRYCILIRLKHPKRVATPFHVNKRGFGSASAWISVPRISDIRI